MTLISSTIPNLINGISQQAYTLRLPSQAEVQENCMSSVVEGLRPRPPTEHVAKLYDGSLPGAFVHLINRDTTERYKLIATNGDLRVFDLTGQEKTVTFPDGKGYLNSANPRSSFRVVTVADYTFFVNTAMRVESTTTTAPTRPSEALISVKQGNYGRTYSVFIDNVSAAVFTTPEGDQPAHSLKIDTNYIAAELFNQLTTHLGSSYTVTLYGNVIHLVKPSGDFGLKTNDGFANNAMIGIKGSVQRFTDLPNRGPDGFVIKVEGDPSNSFDDYFVKLEASNNTAVWKETVKPGATLGFNAWSMPHVLVREANGSFTFKRATWGSRVVGDETSSADPSFIGRTISDVFFYRNRLGFLADEKVIMSRAGDFFEFYRTTVTALLDGDPIDVSATHTKVGILRHALVYNGALLLYSDQTQFTDRSGDLLTPKTVSIKPTSEFEATVEAKPVGAGRHVYFGVKRGGWMGLREFRVVERGESADAGDVTAHVPKYIPNGVFKIASAENENTLCLLSSAEPGTLFVYKYYWAGDDKLQSAWSKWTFGEGAVLLNADFIGSELVLIIDRGDGVYLERMNIEIGRTDDPFPYTIGLDRRVTSEQCAMVYDTDFNSTLLTLPYPETADVVAVNMVTGATPRLTRVDANTFTMAGDVTGVPLILGTRYQKHYRFSPLVLRSQGRGDGSLVINTGRVQVKYVTLTYQDSGHFEVHVTPKARDTYRYKFTGRVIGSINNRLGIPAIESGEFRFPVLCENLSATIDILSDSHLPFAITGAEWEAFYSTRSQRT